MPKNNYAAPPYGMAIFADGTVVGKPEECPNFTDGPGAAILKAITQVLEKKKKEDESKSAAAASSSSSARLSGGTGDGGVVDEAPRPSKASKRRAQKKRNAQKK